MYKSDRAMAISDSGTADLEIVGTSDIVEAFHSDALWKIDQVGTGYVLRSCRYATADRCLRPNGSSIATIGIYEPGNNAFVWTLTPDTAVPDLMMLIDPDTCLPVNGALRSLSLGHSANLENLNLIVSYISQSANTTNYYWQVSNPNIATITGPNNWVTAQARGETTITLHADGSTNTPMYFTLHVPWVDDGVYYIRNWGADQFIATSTVSPEGGIWGGAFPDESSKLWVVTYLGNREYSIKSYLWQEKYLGIEYDASTAGAKMVMRQGNLTSGMKWTFTPTERGALKIKAQSAAGDWYVTNSLENYSYPFTQRSYVFNDTLCSDWLFCEYSNQPIHEDQITPHWCWVACARIASSRFMKSPITQDSAAYYVWLNEHIDARTLHPVIEEGSPALYSGQATQVAQAIEYILGWENCTYYTKEKTSTVYKESVLRDLLDAGNVIIVGRQLNSTGGHGYVVYDYTYNAEIGKYQYYLYDPSMNSSATTLVRTYAWIRNGQDAYYSEHRDSLQWKWTVAYRIGEYDDILELPFD